MSNNTSSPGTGTVKKKSFWGSVWKRYKKSKLAIAGLVMLIIIILLAATADLWLDYEGQAIAHNLSIRLQSPSSEHIFGTDEYGRDVFARIIFGARISLLVGLLITACSLVIGIIFGATAGFFGGKVDNIIMRFMDILLAIPQMLMAISIMAALGNSIVNLVIALTIASVPRFAYVVRSSVLGMNRSEFVEAAHSYGSSNARIIAKHIVPNIIGPIIVQATTSLARSILLISSLSFIGLGLPSEIPEWGAMISAAKVNMRHYPYLIYFPGLAILVSVLSMNLIGDGLRDALDPKLMN